MPDWSDSPMPANRLCSPAFPPLIKDRALSFTTLEPMIGVIEYPDFSRVTVADIPD